MINSPKDAPGVSPKKRVLNEIEAKISNEENSDKVAAKRDVGNRVDHADMVFSCECDTKDCPKNIVLSNEEYTQAHSRSMHFIVIPSHVRLDIEEVVARFNDYCIVKKNFPSMSPN